MPTNITPEQAEKAHELNLRAAERAHEANAAFVTQMSETMMKDAWGVVRTLVLINGEAAISILTFVGGLAARSSTNAAQLTAIASGLMWFAFGLISGTLAGGLS